MKSIGKKAKRYNFYFGKFWLLAIIFACAVLAILAVNKFMDASDNLSMFTLTGVLLIVSTIIAKCIGLLLTSHKPVISILQDRIILANKNPKEILFADINSVKLAESGLQMFSQSLLIFLNNTSGNEDSDLPVISVPLFYVKADRKHLLQLLKLHLGRKAQVTESPALGMEWQEI